MKKISTAIIITLITCSALAQEPMFLAPDNTKSTLQTAQQLLTQLLTPAPFSDIVCPDQSLCNVHQTCCKLPSGGYTCSPYENAGCCADGYHSCPQNYTCSTNPPYTCTESD